MTTLIGLSLLLIGTACLAAANAIFLGLSMASAGASGWIVLGVGLAGIIAAMVLLEQEPPPWPVRYIFALGFTQSLAGMGSFVAYALTSGLPAIQLLPMIGLTVLGLCSTVFMGKIENERRQYRRHREAR